MRTLDRKLLRDLWRIRGQALAIALVTAAGTVAFVSLLGTLNSLTRTQAAYYERYRFADVFANARRAPDSRAAEIASIAGVRKVTSRIVHNVVLDIEGIDEPINGLLVSAPRPGTEALNDIHLRSGRRVQPGATEEVVLNETFANANNLTLQSTLYASIKGNRRKLTVVGIALSPEYIFFGVPGTVVPDDRRFGVLWMDHDALAAAFDLRGAFNDVVLALTPGARVEDVISRLDSVLEPYGGIGAYARKDHVSHATLSGDIDQLSASIQVAAPLFLGVVAFLLHMLMMRHVETEREYIGVLKAFGYGNGTIVWHYLKLVLAIVLVGVVMGLVGGAQLGRIVTELFAANYHFPFLEYAITLTVFVQAAAIQLAAAFVGGMGSVRKAVLLPPAVAMRPPPPPVYRRTPIERLGLRLFGDQPTRMILRHVLRWPVRSGLTTLGIALATAIVLAPMAVLDSAMHMVDVHFFRSERQDLTVAFAQARPQTASLIAFAHEPGVLQVEPFRATLANLRFGDRQRRITVLGRPAVNDLARPLLATLEPLEIPPVGLVVSSSMATWLGARPGDVIELQFLEGRRPLVQLPITAIAQSHVGLTFFMLHMDADELNRLLQDGDVITGVHLRNDPTQAGRLYEELKKIPSITGTVSHSAQLQSMRRIMAQTNRMTRLNVVFAVIIAFGVVYNTARISLAERSRELATMRMLGFTQLEVAYILIGEIALLTTAAVPLGCAIGYALAWKLTEGTSNEMFRLPLYAQADGFGYAILAVVLTVVASGVVVVRRVFTLDLMSMLKTRE
jgi:putative ABC transport system permease protein